VLEVTGETLQVITKLEAPGSIVDAGMEMGSTRAIISLIMRIYSFKYGQHRPVESLIRLASPSIEPLSSRDTQPTAHS
jgi:hypothetical protein